jgi:hypothetical protein
MGRLLLLTVMLLSLAISVLFLAGCHRQAPRLPAKPRSARPLPKTAVERASWRTAEEDDLYEAVLRYGFTLYGPHMVGEDWERRLPQCTFYVSIDGRDPSGQFVARFAGERPVVMKLSQLRAQSAAAPPPQWLGQVAGLDLGKVFWESDTRARVPLSANAGQRANAGWVCVATRSGGRWHVERILDRWAT